MDVYNEPLASTPSNSLSMIKPGVQIPHFETFPYITVKDLTKARKESLRKDVYETLEKSRVNMTEEARSWWKELISESSGAD